MCHKVHGYHSIAGESTEKSVLLHKWRQNNVPFKRCIEYSNSLGDKQVKQCLCCCVYNTCWGNVIQELHEYILRYWHMLTNCCTCSCSSESQCTLACMGCCGETNTSSISTWTTGTRVSDGLTTSWTWKPRWTGAVEAALWVGAGPIIFTAGRW